MQYPTDDTRLPGVREKIEEPEQWIAVDVVHIPWSLGPQNTQGKLSDLLWRYALGLHLINDGSKPNGIAGIQLGCLTESLQLVGGYSKQSGLYGTGTDDRYAISQKLDFHPKRIRITLKCGFCCCVESGERKRVKRRQLTGCDDDPSLLFQQREKETVDSVYPEEIDIEYTNKLLFGDLNQRVQVIHPCNVKNGFEGTRFLLDGLESSLQLGAVCYVGCKKTEGKRTFWLPNVQTIHSVPTRCQHLTGCKSNASACSGYKNVHTHMPINILEREVQIHLGSYLYNPSIQSMDRVMHTGHSEGKVGDMGKGAITLVPVVRESTHEHGVLRNLLKMYCYEWSQYNQLEVDANGRYAFEEQASAYWTKEGYYAFLISVDEQWAGFVFFDTHDFIVHTDDDYSMAEFFVMHAYRHCGIGRYVATRLFDRFGGVWEIGCHPNNLSSVRFWKQVIGNYTLENYKLMLSCPELKYHDGTLGNVISFHTDTQ